MISAARVREELGLRSDSDWLAAVRNDRHSLVNTYFGLRVTRQENAELAQLEGQLSAAALELQRYGEAQPERFGGLYVDMPRGAIVMLFKGGLDQHAAAVAKLAPSVRVDLHSCRFAQAELTTFMNGFNANTLRADGYVVLGYGIDIKRNVVLVEARSDIPDAAELLEKRFDGKVRARIYAQPVSGWTNDSAGPGWRLLAAGDAPRAGADTVRVASDEHSWTKLWRAAGLAGKPPAVQFEREVVFSLAYGTLDGCPGLRLDGLTIDRTERSVIAATSDPLAPRDCHAMLGSVSVFVIAVSREALPSLPFRVQLDEQARPCVGCGARSQLEVRELR